VLGGQHHLCSGGALCRSIADEYCRTGSATWTGNDRKCERWMRRDVVKMRLVFPICRNVASAWLRQLADPVFELLSVPDRTLRGISEEQIER